METVIVSLVHPQSLAETWDGQEEEGWEDGMGRGRWAEGSPGGDAGGILGPI